VNRVQILERVESRIKTWPGNAEHWIHLTGEAGVGKSFLLKSVREQFAPLFDVVLFLDSRINFLDSPLQWRAFIEYFERQYPDHIARYLRKFPGYMRKYFHNLFKPSSKNSVHLTPTAEEEISNFLGNFLRFIGENLRCLVLLDCKGSWPSGTAPLKSINMFREMQVPVFIVSASTTVLPDELSAGDLEQITVHKLSVKENETLLAEMLETHPVNLRLINNHIYTRSAGNPRKVLFYVTGVLKNILPEDTESLIHPGLLKRHIIRMKFPDLLDKNFQELPANWQRFLILLSHFQFPKNVKNLQAILKILKIKKSDIEKLVQSGWIEKIPHLGEDYVDISHEEIKQQLKSFLPISELATELKALESLFRTNYRKLGERISEIYFQSGAMEEALKLAHKEARFFSEMGRQKWAMDRYLFLKRNLLQNPVFTRKAINLLFEIGEYQLKMGLHENAFDTFRELRDRLNRKQFQDWFKASYQMALALYKMDALQEARYLLRNLKLNEKVPIELRARTYYLIGELEKNSGRKEYALKYFEQAAQLAPETMEAEFYFRLYQQLKSHPKKGAHPFEKKLRDLIKSDPFLHQKLELENIREIVRSYKYPEALPHALNLVKNIRRDFSLSMWRQALMYLSEVESFCAKYNWARDHLAQLVTSGLFSPGSRSLVHGFLRLGIVEKELGLYGDALSHLEKALEISFKEHFIREIHTAKLQLGHIYLLVHGYVRAQEYLNEVLSWAIESQEQDLLLSTYLFLSAFELQKMNVSRAEDYLKEARFLLNFSEDPMDELNFKYYYIQFLFATHNHSELPKELKHFHQLGKGIPKFKLLAAWLEGKHKRSSRKFKEAFSLLNSAFQMARKYRMLHFQLLIQIDLIHLAKEMDNLSEFQERILTAREIYFKFLNAINDEILKTQFKESIDYEEIFTLFNKR